MKKRKQDALEDESRRSSASGPSYRRDRGDEEIGEGDASMLGDGPAASLPDTEGKRDFVLSGSEGIMAVGSWAARVEAASLLKARCQPDEYIRLVETRLPTSSCSLRKGRKETRLTGTWLHSLPSIKEEFLPLAGTEV